MMAAIRISAVSDRPDSSSSAGATTVVLVVDDDEVVVAGTVVVVRGTVVDVEVEVLVVDDVVEGVDDDVGWAVAIPTDTESSATTTPPTRIDPAALLARMCIENATWRPGGGRTHRLSAAHRVPFGGCWFELVAKERSGDVRVMPYASSSRRCS